MTEELNKEIALRLFGLVPCDAWKRGNFGSAGGPVLMNERCPHGNGKKCYPTVSIRSIHGKMGGCPEFSSNIVFAWEVVDEMAKRGFGLCLSTPGSFTDEGIGPADRFSADFEAEKHQRILDEKRPIIISIGGRGHSEIGAPEAICKAAIETLNELEEAKKEGKYKEGE